MRVSVKREKEKKAQDTRTETGERRQSRRNWRPRKSRNVCGVKGFKERVGGFLLLGKKRSKESNLPGKVTLALQTGLWYHTESSLGPVVDGQAREQ